MTPSIEPYVHVATPAPKRSNILVEVFEAIVIGIVLIVLSL